MSKTYRALETVAVVALVCAALGLGLWYGLMAGDLPGFQQFYVSFALNIEAFTSSFAPVVGTFGAVVAAQAGRRGWVATFIALCLVGAFAAPSIFFVATSMALPRALFGFPLSPGQLIPEALPSIAALIFVANSARTSGAQLAAN